MNAWSKFILNIILNILPPTRLFWLKRKLLRLSGIDIKDNSCINGQAQFFGHGSISFGSHVWVGIKNNFYSTPTSSIIIGDNCDIGPDVSFICGSHEVGDKKRRAGTGISGDIIIEDGCWIGARVTILGGVTIKSGSIIAAGSVVTKNVDSNCLYAGVPAVFKKKLSES